jgi:hypothetical protein
MVEQHQARAMRGPAGGHGHRHGGLERQQLGVPRLGFRGRALWLLGWSGGVLDLVAYHGEVSPDGPGYFPVIAEKLYRWSSICRGSGGWFLARFLHAFVSS